MFKPLFALHKDAAGQVLAARDFPHGYQLGDWLRNLDCRAGDIITFQEVAVRPEFDEVAPPTPEFVLQTPPAPDAGEDLTF